MYLESQTKICLLQMLKHVVDSTSLYLVAIFLYKGDDDSTIELRGLDLPIILHVRRMARFVCIFGDSPSMRMIFPQLTKLRGWICGVSVGGSVPWIWGTT